MIESSKLHEQVRRLQSIALDPPVVSVEPYPAGGPSFVPHLPRNLSRVAISDPNSFLISPLPEFTGRLPSALESFTALPEFDDNEEELVHSFQEGSSKAVQCTANGHPFSCDCVQYPMFPDTQEPHSRHTTPEVTVNDYMPITQDLAEPTPPPSSSPIPPAQGGLTISGSKDRSSSRHSRSRSRSSASQRPSARDQRIPSPLLKPMTSSISLGRRALSPGASQSTSSLPTAGDTDTLRNRLHELLQDAPTSSSLPNTSSSHFPSSLTRQGATPPEASPQPRPVPPPPQRSIPRQPSPKDVECQPLPHPVSDVPVPALPIGPGRFSSASAAAQAMANAQKAEKERQRAAQKEQEREKRRQEKERDRAERERLRSEAAKASSAVSPQPPLMGPTIYPPMSMFPGSGAGSGSLSRRGSTNAHVRPGSTGHRESGLTHQQRYATVGAKSLGSNVTPSASNISRIYA